MTALLLVLSTLIGTSMGFSGMGGFLLVPMMIVVARSEPSEAVFTALSANLCVNFLSGILSIIRRQVDWPLLRHLLAGSIVGAVVAAWCISVVPQSLARIIAALLLAALGLASLLVTRHVKNHAVIHVSPFTAASLGLVAQVSAVLAGIGGPALTVPILARKLASANHIVGTALVHGLLVSALGLGITGLLSAPLTGQVVLVVGIVVLSSIVSSLGRGLALSVVDLQTVVGALALVGAALLLF